MFVYGNHAPDHGDALPPSVWHQWCSLLWFTVCHITSTGAHASLTSYIYYANMHVNTHLSLSLSLPPPSIPLSLSLSPSPSPPPPTALSSNMPTLTAEDISTEDTKPSAHADLVLYPPKQHSAVPTLAMVFDCGYCPKGVTGDVIKFLTTNKMKSEYNWLLQPDQSFRDQVSFSVGPHLITLCLYPTHFEVVYAPSTERAEAVCSIQDTCCEICKSVKLAIQTVCKDLNLTCTCTPTFYCSLCSGSHIAVLVLHKGIPCQLLCKETNQLCDFPPGYHYWLESTPRYEPEDTKPSAIAASLILPSALKISLSLASEWKNLGVFLTIDKGTLDNIEYKYSGASDCLREMFYTWLQQVDPPPSWQALADAVELLDPAVAEKIRTTYCNA